MYPYLYWCSPLDVPSSINGWCSTHVANELTYTLHTHHRVSARPNMTAANRLWATSYMSQLVIFAPDRDAYLVSLVAHRTNLALHHPPSTIHQTHRCRPCIHKRHHGHSGEQSGTASGSDIITEIDDRMFQLNQVFRRNLSFIFPWKSSNLTGR